MTGFKSHINSLRWKGALLTAFLINYLVTGSFCNNLESQNYEEHLTTNDIKKFLGVFKALCNGNSNTYLTFTLSEKASRYLVQLKAYPANQLIAEGVLKRDTVNFFKEVNVWSITDNHGRIYPFVFNERELEPCEYENCPGYVTLINTDYKKNLGNDCFSQQGYLFFVKADAKKRPSIRKGNYQKEWAILQSYLGAYWTGSSATLELKCKVFLTLAKSGNAYYIHLKFPRQQFSLSGIIDRDTTNFDPDLNIWSIKDKQSNDLYGFLFDPEYPDEIGLVNEDAKEIFERNCIAGKIIRFSRNNHSSN